MCLIALQWQPGADPSLLVVANRDEFHARPTAPLAFWDDAPHVLAGRDLQAGGSWMGVTRDGRFAALTNIREIAPASRDNLSRGLLVANFLRPPQPTVGAWQYAQAMAQNAQHYAGFNLLLADKKQLIHVSNRGAAGPQEVTPGIHGLSNALLDTPWPKVQTVTQGLQQTLDQPANNELLLQIMRRQQPYPDTELPDTGVGVEMERMLSPPFICTSAYGTRATTMLRLGLHQAELVERRFGSDGQIAGEESFQIELSR